MRKGRSRHVLYLLAAVAMLVYGVEDWIWALHGAGQACSASSGWSFR